MDSDEELSISLGSPSSPLPERKLKRLKKVAGHVLPGDAIPTPIHGSVVPQPADPGALDDSEKNGERCNEVLVGDDLQAGFDGSGNGGGGDGSGSGREEDSGFAYLDEEMGGRSDGPVEEDGEVSGLGKEGGNSEEFDDWDGNRKDTYKENEKGVEEEKMNKKRRPKGDVDAPPKKRADKGRRERLKELRAESQRLLRETRDASFRPAPLVQKSVSSVLEKIRQRKREISMMSMDPERSIFTDAEDGYSSEVSLEFNTANSDAKDAGENKDKAEDMDIAVQAAPSKTSSDTPEVSRKNQKEMVMDEELKQNRAPVDKTQDPNLDSQTSDSTEQLDETPSSFEEAFVPSSLAMKLKFGSDSPDDLNSDEEQNDKENIDPLKHGPADRPSSPKGDFSRAFLDDEAEEEDDSDNDRGRFQDDEEEEDEMDSDESDDSIATTYDEKPADKEMCDQLHQKWLEQQDAAATKNLWQKLKYGNKQREMTPLRENEDHEDEEYEEDFLDETEEYQVTANIVRMNLKKAKEMLPHVFTDKDDVYISSDDEETERNPVRGRSSYKTEEHGKRESTAKGASNEDIFGRIKKLNGVQDTKKKAKITTYFDMLNIGGNKTAPLKSSFLGFGRKSSLPSFQKHGSSAVCTFIFERDGSNSRSGISMSENSPDLTQRENTTRKTGLAKFSSSQQKSSSQHNQAPTITNSGPSLHEILRCPTSNISHENSMVSQVEAMYASFKLDRNVVMKQNSVSVRTV